MTATWPTPIMAVLCFAVPVFAQELAAPAQDVAPPLVARQRALQRRVEDLAGRFRELANELAENEPEQSERVAAALARLGDLRLEQRIGEAAERLERGEHEPAAALQRSLLDDLQRLQRFLRTGRDDETRGEGVVDQLTAALQTALAAQRQLRIDASAVVARRAADGAWRRPERLAFAALAKSQRDIAQSLAPFPDRLPDANTWQVVASLLRRTLDDQADVARSLNALQIDATLAPRLQDLETSLDELVKLLRPPTNGGGERADDDSDARDAEPSGEQELPLSIALRALQGEQRRLLERTRQLDQLQRMTPSSAELPAAMERLIERQRQLDQQLRDLLAQQSAP